MKRKVFIICAILLVSIVQSYSQDNEHALTFNVSVAEEVKSSFKTDGRLFIILSTTPKVEPKDQIWPNSIRKRHYLFAKNFSSWPANETLIIKDTVGWSSWGRMG